MSIGKRWGMCVLLALLVCAAFLLAPVAAQAAPLAQDNVYIVQPGDRLVDIAARYGVPAGAIMRANSLENADLIYPGQRLVIPPAGATPAPTAAPATPTTSPTTTTPLAATPEPAGTEPGLTATPTDDPGNDPQSASPQYHVVAPGDTIDKIAQRYGVSAADIIRANGLGNPDVIYAGQKLLISAGAGDVVAPAATPKPSKPVPPPIKRTVHVVQPGETLAKIAQKYSVSVPSLVEENALGSADVIRVGQRLVIPGKGVTTYPGRASKFVASISEQRCWLYQGETIIDEWVCSTGRPSHQTRPGSYKIQSKLPKAYGSTWGIWMPYWLGIYWAGGSENGIHGLPWNADTGVQVWTGFVGTPITYGCLMLDNVHAKTLYDMAYIGMPVIVKP